MTAGTSGGTRTALLAGATGLVGGHCLDLLLREGAYGRVVSLGRRKLPLEHAKLEQRAVDFDRLAETAGPLAGDDVFCCLGTTLRQAGSRDAFRKVDFAYVDALAGLACAKGFQRFLLVTSVGADARSPAFYPRVKGEVEAAVAKRPFAAVHLLRPSMLLGERSQRRPLEALATPLLRLASGLLAGPLKKYRPIDARDVAQAMVRIALNAPSGVHIVESDVVQTIADGN